MSSIPTLLSGIFQSENAATSHLSETLDNKAATTSAGGNWRDSIVDLATLIGMNSDFASRKRLATELEFFGDFNDTAMMNTFLHNRIVMTIVENHAVDVASHLDQLAANRTVELDWRDSVVDLMKLFGLRSRLTRRERLATKLGFTGELGPSGTMNMWLHTRLIVLIVDRGGTLPDDLMPRPERTPERRVEALCRSLKTKDAVVPAMVAIWERRKSGKPSRNEFETGLYGIFDGLNTSEQERLGRAFERYSAFRKNGHGECLFADHLAEAVRNDPPVKKDFAAAIVLQGLSISSQQSFPNSGGKPGPGQVRPWAKSQVDGPPITAPWPWITSIHFGNPSYWFGNDESVRPKPPAQTNEWRPFQFVQTCRFEPLPTGGIGQKCDKLVLQPPPPPPGGMQFPFPPVCEGGINYTIRNECLRIPAKHAGDSIFLSGFNFIAPHVDVHLKSLEVFDRMRTIRNCVVYGDALHPARDEQGKVIVDRRVEDGVEVPLPSRHPEGSDSAFPPGLYEISISVNDPSAPPGAPIVRPSNNLVLRIEPDPNMRFQLECEGGACIKETPGGGDDEIWWDAFVGHVIPNEMPKGLRVKDHVHISLDRAAWEDVDDGEQVQSLTTIFGPRAFELGGVAVIAIVGFEVDSEAAAREQLQGFSDAFFKAVKGWAQLSLGVVEDELGLDFAGILGDAGAGTGATAFASLVTTGASMMAAYVAAVVLATSALWAAWAPADMIALDLFTLNAREASDRTDAAKILPADMFRQFGGVFDDTDVLVKITERALPKSEPAGSAATWRHEIQYDARHDGDEFSSYVLRFRLKRSPVVV